MISWRLVCWNSRSRVPRSLRLANRSALTCSSMQASAPRAGSSGGGGSDEVSDEDEEEEEEEDGESDAKALGDARSDARRSAAPKRGTSLGSEAGCARRRQGMPIGIRLWLSSSGGDGKS